jgi:peptidoglycan/xylan/chitin deacetylase (PgdA/CDA1 family)
MIGNALHALNACRAAHTGAVRLLVLNYHRVLHEHDPMRPTEMHGRVFARHMQVLARFFRVLPLVEALDLLRKGRLPRRAVSLTFDDGYADNLTVGLPILRSHQLPATVFVATRFLNGGLMWHDAILESIRAASDDQMLDLRAVGLHEYAIASVERCSIARTIINEMKYVPAERQQEILEAVKQQIPTSLPDDLMLTSRQLSELVANGVAIGAHTHRHAILTSLSDDQAKEEILASKLILEKETGKAVDLFAYPNGRPHKDYGRAHVGMAREIGFSAALSTVAGAMAAKDDYYQVPRIGPWAENVLTFAVRLLGMYGQRPTNLVGD